MQGDPRTQRPTSNTLQARKLARPPSNPESPRGLTSGEDLASAGHSVLLRRNSS